MSKNVDRYTIWKIENEELNLEGVLDLLNKNYNQRIKYLENYEVDEYDKTLNNKWINPDGRNELVIKEYKENSDSKKNVPESTRYIYAKG